MKARPVKDVAFFAAIVATCMCAGWYSGQVSNRSRLVRAITYGVAIAGVMLVARFLLEAYQ